jgi:hypothetical protein
MFPNSQDTRVVDNLRAMADLRGLNLTQERTQEVDRRWAAFYAADSSIGCIEVLAAWLEHLQGRESVRALAEWHLL